MKAQNIKKQHIGSTKVTVVLTVVSLIASFGWLFSSEYPWEPLVVTIGIISILIKQLSEHIYLGYKHCVSVFFISLLLMFYAGVLGNFKAAQFCISIGFIVLGIGFFLHAYNMRNNEPRLILYLNSFVVVGLGLALIVDQIERTLSW